MSFTSPLCNISQQTQPSHGFLRTCDGVTHSLTSHTSCHGRIIVDLKSANPLEKRSGNFPSSDLNHENFNRGKKTPPKPQSIQEDKTATHALKQNQIFGLDLLKLSLGIFNLYDKWCQAFGTASLFGNSFFFFFFLNDRIVHARPITG